MRDQQAARGQLVTPLELFFDLAVVFAITQVTSFLSADPTWSGLLRGMLLLATLWWLWSAYAWMTNIVDPEDGLVRMTMLAAVAAMLIVALAAPRAFGDDGLVFGVAFFVVRALQFALYAIAFRGDRDLLGVVFRIGPAAAVGASLLVAAGFLEGWVQLVFWGAALAINYLNAFVSQMRGWRISPDHFVERYGLIIIIALGESIFAIGVGAEGLPLDAREITGALLGITVAACLWWLYFDWVIFVAQATLTEATGTRRAALARDVYSYLHLPMVGGIVLFAFGLKTTLAHTDSSLGIVPALGLCGGVALYLLAHVALRLRIGGGIGLGRPVASVLLLGLIPVAMEVPALVAVGIVSAVCVALIAYEFFRHRESRAWIRARRGDFAQEDIRRRFEAGDTQRPGRTTSVHMVLEWLSGWKSNRHDPS
jgi:low temperature requirement protein LtrA